MQTSYITLSCIDNMHTAVTHLLSVCSWLRSLRWAARTARQPLLQRAPCWFALNQPLLEALQQFCRSRGSCDWSHCLSLCCVCGMHRMVMFGTDWICARLPFVLAEFVHGYRLSWPNLCTVTVYPDRICARLPSILTEFVHGYRLSWPNLCTVTVYPDRICARLPSILTEFVQCYRLSWQNWFLV
jgi:hypothetical protein